MLQEALVKTEKPTRGSCAYLILIQITQPYCHPPPGFVSRSVHESLGYHFSVAISKWGNFDESNFNLANLPPDIMRLILLMEKPELIDDFRLVS